LNGICGLVSRGAYSLIRTSMINLSNDTLRFDAAAFVNPVAIIQPGSSRL